ncbi:MAG: hypothetical protein QM718_08020 [Steroidobacteraceae bacterium]
MSGQTHRWLGACAAALGFVAVSSALSQVPAAGNEAPPGAAAGPPPGAAPGGGPGGPGGDLGAAGADEKAEPALGRAEAELVDFSSAQHRDAVMLVSDLRLLDDCDAAAGGKGFCPSAALTLGDLAQAMNRAAHWTRVGATEKDFDYLRGLRAYRGPWQSNHTLTVGEAGRALLVALGVESARNAKDAAITALLREHALLQSLDKTSADQQLTRDEGAQLIANALRAADGSAQLPTLRYRQPMTVPEGSGALTNTVIFNLGATALQVNGSSELVARNARIIGDSSVTTRPLSGPPSGLLIAGSLRTTLALNQSQSYYINSVVDARDWAAWSTDGAVPVTRDGQKELSLFTYGAQGRTRTGGYGAYSDLFCNAWLYGTRIDAAEVGVISGTYGRVALGTIADGERDAALSAHLSVDDRRQQPDKQLGSEVVAGRNALMIHSVSLPPYWGFKGYSQQELPLHIASVRVHGGRLATDLALNQPVTYSPERAGYIHHVAGSVILIRSSNADIDLDGVRLEPGAGGTGAVLHTAINNDTTFMVRVPDGSSYPGSSVRMHAMQVRGDVLNEDYQRDLKLALQSTTLSGRIVSGDAAAWNTIAATEGFAAYAIDAQGYRTPHGVQLQLDARSTWVVTGTSTLRALQIAPGARLQAAPGRKLTLTVDGAARPIAAGSYSGDVHLVVSP